MYSLIEFETWRNFHCPLSFVSRKIVLTDSVIRDKKIFFIVLSPLFPEKNDIFHA